MSDHYAVDFETLYFKDEYDTNTLGIFNYVLDQRFDAYLVAVYGKDINEVCNPKDFDWEKINGKLWVSHNAEFDRVVFWRLKQLGIVPKHIKASAWKCSMQLSLFTSGAGSLANASQDLLGETMEKEMRDYMNRKTWADAVTAGKDKDLIAYARKDAENCWKIWDQYSNKWPHQEQRLAEMTIQLGYKGVTIDQEKLKEYTRRVKEESIKALESLPWIQDEVLDITNSDHILEKGDEWEQSPKIWVKVKKKLKKDEGKIPGYGDQTSQWPGVAFRKIIPGKPALSIPALKQECERVGLKPPKSFGEKDAACQQFEEEYGDKYDFIGNVRRYRKGNKLLGKLQAIKNRIKPDGRMPFTLRYHGAHTGRFSGSGGLNMQNWNKKNTHFPFVDERSLLIAAPGKILGICDLAQIEARITPWVAGDMKRLELMQKMSVYEVEARASMGWTGGPLKKEDPKLYALAKARVLALGFGAGWQKFISMVSLYDLDAEEIFGGPRKAEDEAQFLAWHERFEKGRTVIDQFHKQDELHQNMWVNAFIQVQSFRQNNSMVVDHWRDLDERFKNKKGDVFELVLPSWRTLRYTEVTLFEGETWARGGFKKTRFYGGKLCENEVQAIARDVLVEALFNLEDAGYKTLFHCHDEIICELNDESELKGMLEIMKRTPRWLPSLPIDAEGVCSQFYLK